MRLVDGRRVLNFLRALTAPAGSDADLLRRFVLNGEEAAFVALMDRHGPMVRGACLRLLGNHSDADDVFQATFLLLARRADAIRQPAAVSAWLHGVTCRLAHTIRSRQKSALSIDSAVAVADPSDPFAEACWREVRGLLDEELEQLSESYRLPLVLCYLQELTRDEAAARLGWSVRTLDRRLHRGRELLRDRLRRRGVEAAALATVGLSTAGLSAGVPAPLAETTVRAATAFALGQTITGPAALLAEGALHMFTILRWKWVVGMVMALGMLAAASTLLLPGADPVQPPAPGPKQTKDMPSADAGLPVGAVTRIGSFAFYHGADVKSLHFSPDSQRVLSLSDKILFVWESSSGHELLRLSADKEEKATFLAATFTPDGKAIAVVYSDGMARVWEAASGKELRSRRLHDDSLNSFQVYATPDGRRVLIRTDRNPLIWDTVVDQVRTVSATLPNPQPDHRGGTPGSSGPMGGGPGTDLFANAFGIAINGSQLIVLTNQGLAIVSMDDTAKVQQVNLNQPVGGPTALSPDGKWLAGTAHTNMYDEPGRVAFQQDAVFLWDLIRGKPVRSLNWPLADIRQIHSIFAPDNGSLFVANGPAVIRWDVSTGKVLRQWTNFPQNVTALAVSPDGRTLAAASSGNVRLFDAATGTERLDSRHTGAVSVLAFAPDGKTLYTGSEDRTLRQWDAASGKHLRAFDEHLAGVTALAVSPNGKWIASTGSNNRPQVIRLWDSASGQFVRQLRGHQRIVQALAFSPESTYLVSGGVDGVRVWDVQSGDERQKFSGGSAQATAVAFLQDNLLAIGTHREVGTWASWAADKPVPPKLWDLEEAAILRRTGGTDNSWVAGIAFATQSKRVALAVNHNGIGNQVTEASLVCCDTETGRVIRRLNVAGALWIVAITPDGRKIAAADAEGGVRLWDIDTGAELTTYSGHRGHVRALSFSSDGKRLASGGSDCTTMVWTVP
jgi:RNA polymerase sigma factor (sigma-70 family)